MKKLIVLSADALVAEDMNYLSTLPNFQKYLAGGVGIKEVRSIYPTITYPCHTTMITGVYPEKHGITGNMELHPGQVRGLPWLWDAKFNRWKEDIFTEAKKAGYRTASAFWPVTGNHPFIDDLIDEYWIQFPEDTLRDAYGRMGSNERMLRIVEKNFKDVKRPSHPQVDAIVVDCACDIIRECRPDVLFLHPADVDWARHQYGVFNDQVTRTVENTDRYIGQLMKAVEEIGALADTNLVLTSDHGQRKIQRIVNLNVLLAEHDLIHLDDKGNFRDWDAWCLSGGMSANVYLKDPSDRKLYEKVQAVLQEGKEQKIYGIEQIFTKKEAKEKEHLDGDFSFVLEAAKENAFGDSYQQPLVTTFETSDYRYGRATHGYLPEKGPQPVFWAKGPDFQERVVLEHANLVDETPTLAALLGVKLPHADGRCLKELLR